MMSWVEVLPPQPICELRPTTILPSMGAAYSVVCSDMSLQVIYM